VIKLEWWPVSNGYRYRVLQHDPGKHIWHQTAEGFDPSRKSLMDYGKSLGAEFYLTPNEEKGESK